MGKCHPLVVTTCSRTCGTCERRQANANVSPHSQSQDTHDKDWVINMNSDLSDYLNFVKTNTADKFHATKRSEMSGTFG